MRTATTIASLCVLVLTACQDTVQPEPTLSAEEVALLAETLSGGAFDAAWDFDARADADDARVLPATITTTLGFTLTRGCAVAGQVVFDGSRTREWDMEARTRTDDFTATRVFEQCGQTLEPEDGPVTITVDGAVALEAHLAWLRWDADGLQTLSMTGELDWTTDDERDGTCPVDVRAQYDPVGRTLTIEGVVCDENIDQSTTWD